jgi:hypothetical protein
MQKVFDTYAQRKGIQASSLRFLLDGEKIGADQTPKMLELDDQDQIDCMLEQVWLRVLYLNMNQYASMIRQCCMAVSTMTNSDIRKRTPEYRA